MSCVPTSSTPYSSSLAKMLLTMMFFHVSLHSCWAARRCICCPRPMVSQRDRNSIPVKVFFRPQGCILILKRHLCWLLFLLSMTRICRSILKPIFSSSINENHWNLYSHQVSTRIRYMSLNASACRSGWAPRHLDRPCFARISLESRQLCGSSRVFCGLLQDCEFFSLSR